MTLSLTTMESANIPIENSYVNLEVLDLQRGQRRRATYGFL